VISWPVACALTVALELPLAAGLAPAGRRRRVAGDALLLNLLTHPLAWGAVLGLGWPLLPVEVGVTAAEAVGYRAVSGLGWGRAGLISLLCNGLTTLVGVLA
jgi:hypothetical protein